MEKGGEKICEEFSAKRETLVFNMTIDIWIPYMFYKNGKQIRRIEYGLDLEENEVSSFESGEKQDFEDNVEYSPDSTVGYNDTLSNEYSTVYLVNK